MIQYRIRHHELSTDAKPLKIHKKIAQKCVITL